MAKKVGPMQDSMASGSNPADAQVPEKGSDLAVERMAQTDSQAKSAKDFGAVVRSVAEKVGALSVMSTEKHHRTTRALREPPKNEKKAFSVMVDDMFHYMDSSARLYAGSYDTAAEAADACLSILLECLNSLYKPGMSEAELATQWWAFGDDPWISGPTPSTPMFSAATQMKDKAFVAASVSAKESK
jgi:hypothetical protein